MAGGFRIDGTRWKTSGPYESFPSFDDAVPDLSATKCR